MDPRAKVGLALVVILSVLFVMMYSALIPVKLDLRVDNRSGSLQGLTVAILKDGATVASWRSNVDAGASRSYGFPLDIGSYTVSVSTRELGNATVGISIGFTFLDKAEQMSFTLTAGGIVSGSAR